jgi:hypothetical protein
MRKTLGERKRRIQQRIMQIKYQKLQYPDHLFIFRPNLDLILFFFQWIQTLKEILGILTLWKHHPAWGWKDISTRPAAN